MELTDLPLYRRQTLLARGYDDNELRALRRHGTLVPVRRGTYLAGPGPHEKTAQHRLAARAALDRLSDDAALSHVSAAVWHGLPTWRISMERIHVLRARPSGGRVNRGLHLRTAPLHTDDVVTVDGLRVTSIARTVVDLARTESFESALVTADAALARQSVTVPELEAVLARCKGWHGCPRARRVVAFADGRAGSVGESRSRLAIARAGLPTPEPRYEVRDHTGQVLGRADFGWREQRVVGEFDGPEFDRPKRPDQDAGEVVYVEAKIREDRLRSAGVTVVRWSWDDLADFARTAARLRRELTLMSAPRIPAPRNPASRSPALPAPGRPTTSPLIPAPRTHVR